MNIDELIKNMSLDDKIGQLNQIAFTGRNDDIKKIKKLVSSGKVGAFVLANGPFAGSDKQNDVDFDILNEIQKSAIDNKKIPLLFGRDVIHGYRIAYPVPLAMAATFNFELIKKCSYDVSKSVINDGIRWIFAPMLDISRDPRWGRCIESPGEDAYVGERFAEAVISGFSEGNVMTCAKHFIGYGAAEGGRDYFKTEISEYSLRNHYLKAFKKAADCNVATVMSSFNDINSEPITSNKYLLTDVLKKELKFDGFVVSDWDSVNQLIKQGVAENKTDCARLAISAGLDMDMVSDCYIDNLKSLVEEGIISESEIDESVKRVLTVKKRAGLFDTPYTLPTATDYSKELEDSQLLAEEAMVLLKNSDKTLPLENNEKVYITGPFADEIRSHAGNWALDADISYIKSIRECANDNLNIADNINDADVIIVCLGEDYLLTGENHSLASIEIPEIQVECVKKAHQTGKKVVSVLCFARPVSCEELLPLADSVLYAWHSGTKAANAICNIISGKIVPSGKLPMTIPRRTGQIPIYYNTTSSGRDKNGYYDNVVNYDDCPSNPLFPFGYGLSYTEFEYSDITYEKKNDGFHIFVSVKNIGDYDAKEVVECYINDPVAESMRPIRELKKTKKVFVKCGESKQLEFILGNNEFGYYNKHNKFVVEKGKYNIYVGANCLTENSITIEVD